MPCRLILNADDFGLTPAINQAIANLHHAGVISSASLMATGPALGHAITLAQQNPTLGIGCHLVFVDGIPISHPWDIPTLLGADGKTFRPSLTDFAQAVLRGTVRPSDIARETQAQIQHLQRLGIDVTHVDTHKHTHIFSAVARTVLHIASRCGIPSIRAPFEPAWSRLAAQAPTLRALQIRALDRFRPAFDQLVASSRSHGLVPAGTLGIAATGTLTAATLRATLQALCANAPQDSTWELCAHPGLAEDPALAHQQTRLRHSRAVEYEALLQVIPEIERTPNAPQIIHYGNLGVPGLQRASGQFAPYNGHEKVL